MADSQSSAFSNNSFIQRLLTLKVSASQPPTKGMSWRAQEGTKRHLKNEPQYYTHCSKACEFFSESQFLTQHLFTFNVNTVLLRLVI